MTSFDVFLYIMYSLSVLGMILIIFAIGSAFYFMCQPPDDRWWRMTTEEEMDWLMNEQGLSYDEAKEIVEIPHRR